MRRRSESLISRSTWSSVFAIGASSSSIAFLRASMSAVASVRDCAQPRFGEMQKRLDCWCLSASALSAWNDSRSAAFGVLIRLQPLGMDGAIACRARIEDGRARDARPASRRARQWRGRRCRTLTGSERSMAISIAWRGFVQSSAFVVVLTWSHGSLTRDDERQPRFRQLELRGVDGRRDLALAIGRRRLDALPARPAAIRCSAWRAAICAWRRRSANLPGRSSRAPYARAVDRSAFSISSRGRLTGSNGSAVWNRSADAVSSSPGGLERAVAVEFGAVALETERPAGRAAPGPSVGAGRSPAILASFCAAFRAQDLRAFAFQLPAGKAHPVGILNRIEPASE